MTTHLSNLLRMWAGRAMSNRRPSFLFCVSGLILQCYLTGVEISACGFLILTMCLGRLHGNGLALSWGLFPAAITSAAAFDFPNRDVVLAIIYLVNLILVHASHMNSGPQNTLTHSGQAEEISKDALRAERSLSMVQPVKFTVGPVLGSYRGVPIPEFVEDEAGRRFMFLRIEPGPVASIQEGEVLIAPGFVFATEEKD